MVDDDGYLTISDRKKDVIITGGENVSSIEVEDVLFSHPAVSRGRRDRRPRARSGARRSRRSSCWLQGEEVSEAELIACVQGQGRRLQGPTSVEFRDELARTATGKLQKFKLRDAVLGGVRPPVN